MITPEIRELQIFLALIQTGSFSAAAQKLGVTQPAVSAQILKLEQVIGFPLFYRCPEGTVVTEQGRALIPLAEDVVKEYADLLLRVAYWKRAQSKQVKIWSDGSTVAQNAQGAIRKPSSEEWRDLEPSYDWPIALRRFEVDIVLAGSFLKDGDVAGVKTLTVRQQRGITVAWNPTYYDFNRESFSLAEVISSTVILPAPLMAIGFREFLSQWCKSVYGLGLEKIIECRNEADAVNACKLGLGVLIFPGNVEEPMKLRETCLETLRAFEFLLPKAFTFGIRYRADERNPQILAAVDRLSEKLRVSS
jgi:DNA-binding transcriptional LysR family regulator